MLSTQRARAVANDLSQFTVEDSDFDTSVSQDILGWNGTLRAGLATETEVGLSRKKFILIPVLTEIASGAALGIQKSSAVAYVDNLAVIDAHGAGVRHGQCTNEQGRRLKARYENFKADRAAWTVNFSNWNAAKKDITDRLALGAISQDEATVAISNLGAAPNVAKAEDYSVDGMHLKEVKHVPKGFPDLPDSHNGAFDSVLAEMTAVCMLLNLKQLTADYADKRIKSGLLLLAAYSVAMAYRMGAIESTFSQEFIFVQVEKNNANAYVITGIDETYSERDNKVWDLAATVGTAPFKMHRKLVELGGGAVINAGYNHYQVNHTTGGSRLAGPLVPLLLTNGLFDRQAVRAGAAILDNASAGVNATEEDQTTLVYNVLHPVNKRTIAARMIGNSRVHTYYCNIYMPVAKNIEKDSFLKVREKASPAGTHKVAVASLVLQKILAAGLAPFLPWYDQLDTMVGMVEQVHNDGALAHPGARYYTDASSTFSQSECDSYLPELAYYVMKKMPAHTLAQSPHLARAIADGADNRWKQLVDSVTVAGVSADDAEALKQYLSRAGPTVAQLDLKDPTTWDNVLAKQEEVAQRITNAMRR